MLDFTLLCPRSLLRSRLCSQFPFSFLRACACVAHLLALPWLVFPVVHPVVHHLRTVQQTPRCDTRSKRIVDCGVPGEFAEAGQIRCVPF